MSRALAGDGGTAAVRGMWYLHCHHRSILVTLLILAGRRAYEKSNQRHDRSSLIPPSSPSSLILPPSLHPSIPPFLHLPIPPSSAASIPAFQHRELQIPPTATRPSVKIRRQMAAGERRNSHQTCSASNSAADCQLEMAPVQRRNAATAPRTAPYRTE